MSSSPAGRVARSTKSPAQLGTSAEPALGALEPLCLLAFAQSPKSPIGIDPLDARVDRGYKLKPFLTDRHPADARELWRNGLEVENTDVFSSKKLGT